jgi:hypothetical protein
MTIRLDIAGLVVGVALAAVGAASVQAAPQQPSPEAYDALHRRSVALNVMYGLDKPAGMTHEQFRALLIRSAALNEQHRLPVVLTSTEIARLYGTGRGTVPAGPAATPRGDPFDWADALVGAAAVTGIALLGVATVMAVNRHGHVAHPRI